MKEQKIICGDRSRLYAKENRAHEACGAMVAVSREDITFLEEIRHKIKVGDTAKADKMCEHWIEELNDRLYGAKIVEKEQGTGYICPTDIPMYIVSSHIRQGIDWYDKYVNEQNQAIQPRDLTNIDDKGE